MEIAGMLTQASNCAGLRNEPSHHEPVADLYFLTSVQVKMQSSKRSPATCVPETINGFALLPAVPSCSTFCWMSVKVLLVLFVCASTKLFLLHIRLYYSLAIGIFATQPKLVADLLMTMLAGCSSNAERSSLPSTSSTYGMPPDLRRLLP